MSAEFKRSTVLRKHNWGDGQVKGQPCVRCRNKKCYIVWWPDRQEPRSECKGVPTR